MYVIHRRWYVINPKQNTPAVMPYTLRVITYALRRLHTNPSDWITKKERSKNFVLFCVGTALFSRAASSQVFSALVSLTSVFGMGTGGPSPPLAPTLLLRRLRRRYIKQVALIYIIIFIF